MLSMAHNRSIVIDASTDAINSSWGRGFQKWNFDKGLLMLVPQTKNFHQKNREESVWQVQP